MLVRKSAWRSLAGGVVATGLGLSLAFATYFWVFETGACADVGSVSCRINANEGILTVLTIVLAVIALWTAALGRTIDRRQERDSADRRFAQHLEAAVGESRHNLIHIAMAYNRQNRLARMPQVQVFRARDLDTPEFRYRLKPKVRSLLDSVVRMGSRVPERLPAQDDPPFELVSFTVALMRFMNAVICLQPDHPASLHGDPIFRDMVQALDSKAPCPFFASEVKADLAQLRTHQTPVFCWIKDEDLEGVEVVDMKQRTRDFQLDYLRQQRP